MFNMESMETDSLLEPRMDDRGTARLAQQSHVQELQEFIKQPYLASVSRTPSIISNCVSDLCRRVCSDSFQGQLQVTGVVFCVRFSFS